MTLEVENCLKFDLNQQGHDIMQGHEECQQNKKKIQDSDHNS